jgi:ferrochelatase
LFGIVLNTRPKRVGKAYEEIWNNDLDESYLRTYTRNQSDMLGQALAWATLRSWSTGRCATASRRSRTSCKALKDAGCDRIVLFPLYPQYAAATTATVNDKAFQAMMDMRWQPAIAHRAALS